MDIVLVSHNAHKIKEMNELLDPLGDHIHVRSLDDIGFVGEIKENGTTFEENALIKARAVTKLGYIGIADDSGLCVEALDGAPGVYSARYAGEPCNDLKNNLKLLNRMGGEENRNARFVSVIALAFPNEEGMDFTVRGECMGTILDEFVGEGGFGYDPLFYVAEIGKTYAEMTAQEKNKVSHRAKAMKKFVAEFAREVYREGKTK